MKNFRKIKKKKRGNRTAHYTLHNNNANGHKVKN